MASSSAFKKVKPIRGEQRGSVSLGAGWGQESRNADSTSFEHLYFGSDQIQRLTVGGRLRGLWGAAAAAAEAAEQGGGGGGDAGEGEAREREGGGGDADGDGEDGNQGRTPALCKRCVSVCVCVRACVRACVRE